MSLLGFNFSFGAKDDGFASALSRAGAGLKGVSHQVDSLADKVSTGNFFNALNTLQLDRIGDQLSELKGQGQQLETGLEGTFRNMSAEIRPMLAQMGLTNKEFKEATSQITSTAYSLNVGAGEVAQSFRAIKRAGQNTQNVFKSMGIGMKELTLITKISGMEAEQFSGLVRNLTESYRFTTEETKGFLDGFTNLTQGLGIADVAFGSLQETMSTLDDVLSSNTQFMAMSREEQAKHVQDQVMGVQRLTKAFMGLGKSPQEAQASALQFFKTISSERKNVNGMTIGIGDMGEMFKSLAEEAGFKDVEKLFSNISGDPTKALQQIVEMQAELAKAGDPAKLARFNSKLQEMMGGLSFMGDAGKGFNQRLAEVNKATEKAGDGLVAMAKKGHTANRGLDEVLQMMEDRFEANLMKLTGQTRTKFVQRQKEMYKVVGDEAKKLAGDENWGPLFKQFVSARKLGASAFFMPMERDSKQLSKTLGGIGDAVGRGGLMGRFQAIKTLGIQGFFLDLDSSLMSNEERLRKAEGEAGKYFARLEAFGLTADVLKPALISLGTAFAGLFMVAKLVSVITPFISLLGSLLPLLGTVAGGVMTAVGAIVASPVVIGLAIAGAVYAIGEGIKYLANAPAEFFQNIATSIDNITAYLDSAFMTIMEIDVAGMTNKLLDYLEVWVTDVFKGLGKFFGNSSKWMPVVRSIGNFFLKLGLVTVAGLAKIGDALIAVGSRIVGYLGKGFVLAKDAMIGVIDDYILTPISNLATKVSNAFTSIKDSMLAPFVAIGDFFKSFSIANIFKKYVVAPLASVMDFFANMMYDFANFAFFRPIEALVNKLGDIIKFFYSKMPDFVTSRLDKMGLGEIGRKGFQADFQMKRESEAGFYEAVMSPDNDLQKTVEVVVNQDAVLRESQQQTAILNRVATALEKQNKASPDTPTPIGRAIAPIPLR